MSAVRTTLVIIGMALLCWVSIIFVFTIANLIVLVFGAIPILDFGWRLLTVSAVFNGMTGLFTVALWAEKSAEKCRFTASLTGFLLACIHMSVLVLIAPGEVAESALFNRFSTLQLQLLLAIPALTVFVCLLYLWSYGISETPLKRVWQRLTDRARPRN